MVQTQLYLLVSSAKLTCVIKLIIQVGHEHKLVYAFASLKNKQIEVNYTTNFIECTVNNRAIY